MGGGGSARQKLMWGYVMGCRMAVRPISILRKLLCTAHRDGYRWSLFFVLSISARFVVFGGSYLFYIFTLWLHKENWFGARVRCSSEAATDGEQHTLQSRNGR